MAALKRRAAPRPGRAGEAGFAMVEALIAFAVMAIGLGTLAGGIAVALRADARSASTVQALRVAQSLYAQAGISAALASRTGDDGGGFHWRIEARPVQVAHAPGLPGGTAPTVPSTSMPAAAPAKGGPGLVWVAITVDAPGGGRAELAGLKPVLRTGPPR